MRRWCVLGVSLVAACSRANPLFGLGGEDDGGSNGGTSTGTPAAGTTSTDGDTSGRTSDSTGSVLDEATSADSETSVGADSSTGVPAPDGGAPACDAETTSPLIQGVQFNGVAIDCNDVQLIDVVGTLIIDGGGSSVSVRDCDGCDCKAGFPTYTIEFTETVVPDALQVLLPVCARVIVEAQPFAAGDCGWTQVALQDEDSAAPPLAAAGDAIGAAAPVFDLQPTPMLERQCEGMNTCNREPGKYSLSLGAGNPVAPGDTGAGDYMGAQYCLRNRHSAVESDCRESFSWIAYQPACPDA